MATAKRYTNTTFTHRVDREAGRKRPARSPTEPRVCATCGAVYQRRRWVAAHVASPVAPVGAAGRPPASTQCPACRRIAAHVPSGYVYVDGAFSAKHRDELVRLIMAEAARAAEDNPVGRIIAWEPDEAHVAVVSTTTEHLAQRLGHALQKAYDGEVRFDFGHENKFARVYWRRE